MSRGRRTLRHPFGGRRRYPRVVGSTSASASKSQRRPRQPRLRPRRSVNVAALVANPEEVPSRPRLRMRVVGVIVFALFGVMVLRLWSLQIIDRRQYAAAVNTNALRTVTVPAPRGLVVDRNDSVLAGNTVENEIVLSRAEAHSDPSIVGKVAALVGLTPKSVRDDLSNEQYSPYQPVPVLKDAPTSTLQYLEAHQSEFPGVSIEQATVRDYPQGGTTATQVLGYVGPITGTELKAHPNQGYTESSQIGKTGIEEEYESYLRGSAGQETLEVNATGTVEGPPVRETKAKQGDTVVLNITTALQKQVQSALSTDISNDRRTPTDGRYPAATNGAAVVMNVKTGAVYALTSYPSYSLTVWVGGISTSAYHQLTSGCTTTDGGCPLNDYAIDGLYTPGSTFKLATATAALQDGLITPTTSVDDTGIFDLKTHGDPTCTSGCSFHDATAYDAGIVNVTQAIVRSDDFFFYTMGWQFYQRQTQFGPTPIQNEANKYGFGEMTDIDLPNEVQGRVDSQAVRKELHKEAPTAYPNTYWYAGTNIEMAFGQGATVVTPIEEAQAYATFADDGVKHKPEVAGAIVSPSGSVVKSISPDVTGHVTISPQNYQAMLDGFVGVTHTPRGTAYGTFQADSHVPSTYVIAGKTGTATTATSETTRLPNAWFVGFGPVGGTTEYVVAVAVAQGGYGASAAAPAVANIFNYLYAHPPSASLTLPTATRQPSTAPAVTVPAPTTTTTTTPAAATPPAATPSPPAATPSPPAATTGTANPNGNATATQKGTATATTTAAVRPHHAARTAHGSASASAATLTAASRAPP